MSKNKIFNDPVHGFISVPHPLLFSIIEHPFFQRLRRIKQLGLTDYVYPGAHHTRFHHALGAMHLMQMAIQTLKGKAHNISEHEEVSAMAAILLHDIGHGPYSHTLESCLVSGVHHETISLLFMDRLNEEFEGKLDTAIQIFKGSYQKKFLHQLVSSQLDVDRLDYLTRDSFFTGVSEGVINYDRIIKMMDIKNDQIVIEAKGIYSIEKFIIARRLMYWQVYLHKTVLCVEQMLVKIIDRAKTLAKQGVDLPSSPPLRLFLYHDISTADFEQNESILVDFSRLDDMDIFAAIKMWCYHEDKVLSKLCKMVVNRKLLKIKLHEQEADKKRLNTLHQEVAELYNISEEEAAYFVLTGPARNHAYNPGEDRINILFKDGQVVDIAEASDQLNIQVLSKPVVKYYLCYPKDLLD